MKNLSFKISNVNWSEQGPGDWKSTVYKIYDDLSVDIIYNYVQRLENKKIKNTIIEKNDYKKISKLMEKTKNIKQYINACDGDAWEFIYYKNNDIYIKRDMGYIYGIDILEKIQNIVEKLKNK